MIASYRALLLAGVIATSAMAGETPKPMLTNVHTMAEAVAMLDVCFKSTAYKTLPNDRALKLHNLRIRISTLVERIGKQFLDEALYPTYELAHLQMSDAPDIKSYAQNKYQYCGSNLFTDMEAYVFETEKTINDFLSRDTRKRLEIRKQ
jgi:hypothetical protein